MSRLRALSIIIVSFYSVMFYSWQSLLPAYESSNHIAWAQNLNDTQNENIQNENVFQLAETPIVEEEEPEEKSSGGIIRTIGSLFILDKEEDTEIREPIDYYIEALEYYRETRYNLAFLHFNYAVSGDEKEERAYFWIAQMYHLGQGGNVNLDKAYEFYLLAYKVGDARIYNPEILKDLYGRNVKGVGYLLGKLYYDGKNIARDDFKALKYFQTEADRGHVESLYYIGLIHYEGYQTEQSYLLAVDYLRKASAQNFSDAHVLLGRIFYRGEGYIGKDPERTIRLFTQSALQKDMKGLYYLAGLYYVGDIVAQDYQNAKRLFEDSAAQNYAPSQYFLGQIYFNGHGVTRDYQKALDWYKRAAAQEHVPAILRVAQFYQLGYGVAEDENEALDYYKQAALLGSADARFQLAMMYYKIDDGDIKKVLALLYEAANNGHMMAQYNLGQFYRHGIGVEHDSLLAWVWFNIALNHGNQQAKQDVEAMQERLSLQQIQQGQNYLDRWLRDNINPKSLAYNK